MPANRWLKSVLRSRIGRTIVQLSQSLPGARFVLNSSYDPTTGFHVGSGDMQRDWDARARQNARFFIAVDDANSPESFEDSGTRHLELILQDIPWKPAWRTLEIGCGVGRLLKPLSQRVSEVHGVDISAEMIRQARANLAGLANAHVHQTTGDLAPLASESFDFIYSYRVFQHISQRTAIEKYLQEAARVLKPSGWMRFQVCTSDKPGHRARSGGTWFGILFREEEMPALVASLGLKLVSVSLEAGDAPQALWQYQMVTCVRL